MTVSIDKRTISEVDRYAFEAGRFIDRPTDIERPIAIFKKPKATTTRYLGN